MKEVTVGDRVIKIPNNYKGKRKAEKLIAKLRAKLEGREEYKITNYAEEQLRIPIRTDHHTITYVREKHVYKDKWLRYFDSIEELEELIDFCKQREYYYM